MSWRDLGSDASIVLLGLVAVAALAIILWALRNGVPPMPSSGRVRAALAAQLRRLHLPREASVIELGSGWGGVSLEVSRALPKATVTGYENSPVPLLFSLAVRRLVRARCVHYVRADFHAASLRGADVVICYLSPAAMTRLQPKFAAELKASAIVISITFALPLWKAKRIAVANDLYRSRIYVYPVGACRSDASGRHINVVESPAKPRLLIRGTGGADRRAAAPSRPIHP